MRRKNYALFMALPGNSFSDAILSGAIKSTEEENANLFVFPYGIIDGRFKDMEACHYKYQYHVCDGFFSSDSIDGVIVEYGTIVSDIAEERKNTFLSRIGDMPTYLLSEDAEGFASICFDNYGLRDVIVHLIEEHHCRRIGYVSGPKDNHDARDRLDIYRSIVKEYQLGLTEEYIVYGNFSIYSKEIVAELLDRNLNLDAIVFANDDMAVGGYSVFEERGIQPGKDLLVTGFDNIPSSAMVKPKLTTVSADAMDLSYQAIKRMSAGVKPQGEQRIHTKMVKRQSCGCSEELFFDQHGVFLGSKSEEEYYQYSVRQLDKLEKNKDLFGELELVMREVVFNQDSREKSMCYSGEL